MGVVLCGRHIQAVPMRTAPQFRTAASSARYLCQETPGLLTQPDKGRDMDAAGLHLSGFRFK